MNLAVGFFDGVHAGHQRILDGADSVFTFTNHPDTVLDPENVPPLLMDCDERVRCLETAGFHGDVPRKVFAVEFTRDLAQCPPERFAEILRNEHPSLTRIHCGANWRFGANGAGTPETLRGMGFDVKVVPYATYKGERISSTRIRETLMKGCVEDANAMLGRRFSAAGRVFRGKGVAHGLGVATVNIAVSAPLRLGVYAVATSMGHGVANYGVAPTMGSDAWTSPVLEIHLLDAGRAAEFQVPEVMRTEFYSFIRPEMKFASVCALKSQMAEDVDAVRRIFRQMNPA